MSTKGNKSKQRGMLSSEIVLLCGNARVHTSAVTKKLLQCFQWEVFHHPPDSPNFWYPLDFHLFHHIKEWIGGKNFGTEQELQRNAG